ncbi:MAG: S8 family serine peptidase [Myxococcales bacterium]|nr:S8 family serine peptidase [Myxococcales bacterium]
MTKPLLPVALLLIVLAVIAMVYFKWCNEEPSPNPTPPPTTTPTPPPSTSAALTQFVCRYTPTDDGPSCPAPNFAGLATGERWAGNTLSDVRDTGDRRLWCVYDYMEDLTQIAANARRGQDNLRTQLAGLAPNRLFCEVDNTVAVGLQGDVPPPESLSDLTTYPGLYTSLAQQAGVRNRCPSGSPWTDRSSPVLVAVIDNVPPNPKELGGTRKIRWGNIDRHGTTLGLLIREFSGRVPANPDTPGSQETCGAEVLTMLALDTVIETSPTGGLRRTQTEGGTVGTQASVARAIVNAVNVWQETNSKQKLVINLSIGWEPGQNTFGESSNPVLDAIRFAVEKGALIIAAAGNRPSLADVYQGLMYPAGYANLSYDCSEEERCPLVVAVSGIDGENRVLTTSRPLGTPQLLAPAQAALGNPDHLAKTPPEGSTLSPMTGTSVAAALVSAAAARVWSLEPNLEPHEVMKRIWRTAQQLPEPNELPVMTTTSMIPSICHTVSYATCDTDVPVKPRIVSFCHADQTVPTNEPCYQTIADRAEIVKSTQHDGATVTYTETGTFTVSPNHPCGANFTYRFAGSVMSADAPIMELCPEKVWKTELANLRIAPGPISTPVVVPQPNGCGCEDCSLYLPNAAIPTQYNLSLALCASSPVVYTPQLTLINPTTQATQTIRLGLDTLEPDQRILVSNIEIKNLADFTQAMVTGRDTPTGGSTRLLMSQVLQ